MPSAILLQDVDALGERGAVVDVSKGYLRNYLLPRNLAQVATPGALKDAARKLEVQERAAAAAHGAAEELAATLGKTVLTIAQQAGDDGRLFGSVTPQDIVDAIKESRGVDIERRKVHLEEPIRNIGTYIVVVEVGDGVTANVKTMVVERK